MEKPKRDKAIAIRMTVDELAELQDEASKEGLPISAVIRRRLFWTKSPTSDHLPKVHVTPVIEGGVVTEVDSFTADAVIEPATVTSTWGTRNAAQSGRDALLAKINRKARSPKK